MLVNWAAAALSFLMRDFLGRNTTPSTPITPEKAEPAICINNGCTRPRSLEMLLWRRVSN